MPREFLTSPMPEHVSHLHALKLLNNVECRLRNRTCLSGHHST